MKSPRKELPRWGVYLIRKKGVRLGTVEAKDQDDAVKKAIEQFEIREADRMRVSVQRDG